MCNKTFKLVRFFSTHSRKTRFVTTPIFYVNASPHIGHLYSAVIADAVNRYYQIKNPASPSIFSTGTDEHGTKIQQAATDKNTTIKSYCDRISGDYKSVFQEAGVAYTDFIRTTEDRHLKSVHKFWNVLQEKDCIYSADYSGWYCVSDETFLTESQLKESPDGTKISLESGHPAQWTEELNYMFKLSQFQDDVVYWIKNGDRITPPKFKKILLNYLEEPLPDISVSRPSARVHWGIPVPNDPSQTIYVWLDALVNYLTCAGYPDNKYLQNWPPTDQVIGKDILKFHGVYWPAFLIAAGMEPPKRLLVHSHWTVDGQKMSKSKFNVVDPFQRAQIYSMEGLRYFLLREGVAHSDGNYSDIKVLRILNSELADTLGNLLSRACGKSLNPRQVFPQVSQQHFQDILELDATKRLIETITQLPEKCVQHYEMYNFYLVVDQVMATLHTANNFFESCRPWELKTKPISPKIPANHPSNVVVDENENAKRLETIISVTMDTLRKCAIILQPIIPHITKQLLDKLNVGADERTWDNLKVSAWDMDAKKEERSLGKSEALLFRRIILEKDKDKKNKLTTTSRRS